MEKMAQYDFNLLIREPVLENRIGKEWFAELPENPGVYFFMDSDNEIIYIGKSKNLKKRLHQYKTGRSGKVSGKLARLISKVAEIKYEETATEKEALLLENKLIRKYRPDFNHVNKHYETYYYIYLKPETDGIHYELSMKFDEEKEEEFWYGCFKGHRMVRRSMGCLIRLIWMIENQTTDPFKLPVQLTRNLTPWRFLIKTQQDGMNLQVCSHFLELWMLGESCELIDWIVVHFDTLLQASRDQFQNRYFEAHLEYLKTFYDRKLKPHKQYRGDFRLLKQNELDDAMVMCRGF